METTAADDVLWKGKVETLARGIVEVPVHSTLDSISEEGQGMTVPVRLEASAA
jgi:hypothetical protein